MTNEDYEAWDAIPVVAKFTKLKFAKKYKMMMCH